MNTNKSASTSEPSMKQPTFDWKAKDKYNELLNFEMVVKNIFMTKGYGISDSERVPIVLKWL